MYRRALVAGVALVATVGLAGCGSSHKAKSKSSSTLGGSSGSSTTTRGAHATTTTPGQPSGTPTSTTSAGGDGAHRTTTPPAGTPTTTVALDAQTVAQRFFAAWLAHDSAAMRKMGSLTGILQAQGASGHTSGAPWQLSNCQGASGSQYCTWVRAAEEIVVRANNVTLPHYVDQFSYQTLQPLDIANQFVIAWEFGSSGALHALGDATAVAQIQALDAHRNDGWEAAASCEGTAGSFYCVLLKGKSKLTVQVGDVQLPRQVRGVTYKP